MSRNILLALSLAAATVAVGISSTGAEAAPVNGPRNLVVALQGEAHGELRTVDLPDGPVDAMCFDVDMIDVATGRKIGTGTDCLYNIAEDGNGITLTDVTIFDFPNGTIVATSEVGVQPTVQPFPNTTHLTGSIPHEGQNSILEGTGRFRRSSGSVRLSGAVDMSRLESEGAMHFNCIFVIDLD